ncbi:hypothetical protein MK851_11740 [Tenacibaculum sp. 1B UA]|uniref:hypothetical protein n=1 Tax=Tenacibaculum sp. 1B UA TaxID=2922252 RepID=UPI002A24407C|nr:hypothetical protein [Tenacibaculum sp. 1B UA]MDX8554292.1 hypothetical protein [Tenacibaculum sp. 1B UA]
MLKRDQKIYGYVKEDNDWTEFNAWELMQLNKRSETEYREWHSRYYKKIHVNRDIDSPLIFFHRGHGTFSYFSEEDRAGNTESKSVTISHLLRQKIISERKEAVFSIRNIINKKINTKKQVSIIYKKVLIEETIYVEGKRLRPDITIEFDEPFELALKWNNKLYIEVVENNETNGDKINLLKKTGHGVIEIPYSKHFDVFKKKSFKQITKQEVDSLEYKIKNFFNKSIWSDLIVDPSSDEYKKMRFESIYFQKYNTLKIKNNKLVDDSKRTEDKLEESKKIIENLLKRNEQIERKNQIYQSQKEKLKEEKEKTESLVHAWNKKSFFWKLIKGFKIEF